MTADLPSGWSWTTLGALGEYLNGRGFKKSEWDKEGRPIIRIQNLTGSSQTFNYFGGEVEPRHVVEPGDLLLSWAATLGAFIWEGPEAVLNQHIFKVRSHIDKKFHFYLLKATLPRLEQQTHGSGMVHITKSLFDKTPVVLPPLDEQQRIVAAIEEQFSRLDAAEASIRDAERRMSLLASSIRESIFAGWELFPLSEVSDLVTGTTPSTRIDEYWGRGLPFITPGDFDHGGRVTEGGREVTPMGASKARLLGEGAVLITCIGATIGKTARAEVACVTNQQITALVPDQSKVRAGYLFHVVCSPTFQRAIRSSASSTAMPILNKGRLATLRVPVPSLVDQDRLVTSLETSFGRLTSISADISHEHMKSAGLRASLLRDALAGRLSREGRTAVTTS